MTKPGRITRRRDTLLTVIERVRQALAYGRVSTDQQRDQETIKNQQLKLVPAIQVRENPELPERDRLYLAGTFWDEGVSGTIPLDERPEGRRLVNLICRNGDIACRGHKAKDDELSCSGAAEIVVDEVWITKLDRLGRTLQVLIEIERFLDGHGVALVSLDFGINTSTPIGRLIFSVLGAIAQWERETIIERTTDGKHRNAADGKWVGGRYPYGLTIDDSGFLVVDDQLVKVVESVFDNIALHDQTSWAEGVRTGLGDARIRSIIHNPRYKGEGGIETTDAVGNVRWIAAREGKVPQVIEPWKWQLAQDKLTANSKNADRNRHYDYLLTGAGVRVLTCCEPHGDGICGRTFAGRSEGRHGHQEKYVYYYCSRSREEPEHTAKMLRGKDLEDAVWHEVDAVLRNPGQYLDEARKAHNADGVISRLRQDLTGAIEQLARLDTERQNVLRSGDKGQRSEAEVDARLGEIAAERRPLEALRAALEVQLRSAAVVAADEQRAAIVSADLATTLDEINETDDRAKKRELIKAVVERAEVRTVDGQAVVKLLLRVGAELSIVRASGQLATDNTQQHEPVIVVREITLPRHHPGPRRGQVRRPDVAARNARAARSSSRAGA
jgi:site-specific DNA recombinase